MRVVATTCAPIDSAWAASIRAGGEAEKLGATATVLTALDTWDLFAATRDTLTVFLDSAEGFPTLNDGILLVHDEELPCSLWMFRRGEEVFVVSGIEIGNGDWDVTGLRAVPTWRPPFTQEEPTHIWYPAMLGDGGIEFEPEPYEVVDSTEAAP